MTKTYITEKGKQLLLELAFLGDGTSNNFNYLALGTGNSTGSNGSTGTFDEVSDSTYHRATLYKEDYDTAGLAVSAIFDDTNYQPTEGGEIGEIGIVNQYERNSSTDNWFAFLEVPKIKKDGNISLKYTIVISIDDNKE